MITVCLHFRSAADGASSPNCDVDTLVWLDNRPDLTNAGTLPAKISVNNNFAGNRKQSKRHNSKFQV